jgi:IclR family pca regulon transcriptional regulator
MPQAKRSNDPVDFQQSADYIQSLERGIAVIRAFGSQTPAMTLSAVSKVTGLSRAVVRRQLLTLAHLGYVRQDGRAFALTPRVLELGYGFLGSLAYPEIARLPMEALSRRVHESCSLGVLDGTDVVYMQRVPVRKVMTVALGIGARLPAFCTSMGRVLLAGLAEPALDAWLAALEPRKISEHTCTNRRELRRLIRRAGEDGFAYVEQELERGLCSIAVPLRNPAGTVVAALNAGMPYRDEARARALGEVLPALRDTAGEIERLAGPRFPAGPGIPALPRDAVARSA